MKRSKENSYDSLELSGTEQNNIPDINDIVSLIEEDTEEENELDLLKLVSTDANNSNQYLLFVGSDKQYYAQNVSKIEELLVYKDLDIVRNHDKNNFIFGTANIRGKSTSIILFDKWMGSEVLDNDLYELVILSSYGGRRFAMVVKEVEDIVSIDACNMVNNSCDNLKSSFISHLLVNGVERLCTIFDGDMLLMNIFSASSEKNIESIKTMNSQIKSEKIILFADDSHFVRKMVEKLFLQLGFSYKIYDDGQELINEIKNMEIENIALIITDLEMPKAGGREVINFIRKDKVYDSINIIVHTNMSNNMTEEALILKTVSKVIEKVDMQALTKAINQYIV